MTKRAALRRAALEVVEQHRKQKTLPTSIRFLYYELISVGVISKVRTGARRSDQDLIDVLTDLREKGAIAWEETGDETRSLTWWHVAATVAEWLREELEAARIDPWKGRPPLVITESRSLADVLTDLSFRYRVPITSTNGQCTGFLHTDVAPFIEKGCRGVLYFGDFDFSGGHIERNTRNVLEQLVGDLNWERVALTEQQVKDYGLTVIQKYDARTKLKHPAVETEALRQDVLVRILDDRLRQFLAPLTIENIEREEERQRRRIVIRAR